eukprot:m.201300 g.201300  ORF g.201300 m.201300 type:complete len:1157 (-) comp10676_c0_seq1:2169-5639(-)
MVRFIARALGVCNGAVRRRGARLSSPRTLLGALVAVSLLLAALNTVRLPSQPNSDSPAILEAVVESERDDHSLRTAWQCGSSATVTDTHHGFLHWIPRFDNHPASNFRPQHDFELVAARENYDVAVVIPQFNVVSTFGDTLRSLRRQTLQHFELIIVDDASPQSDWEQVLWTVFERTDPRVRVIRHEHNKGLSAARNTGFRHTEARFVQILDPDDLLEPCSLEMGAWLLHTQAEAGFVKGYTVGFGAKNYTWFKGFLAREEFLTRNTASEATMIRRSTWERVGGFDESMRTGMEDYDFWLHCASHGIWGATIPQFYDWYRRKTDEQSLRDWSSFADPPDFRGKYPLLFKRGIPAYHFQPVRTVNDAYQMANFDERFGARVLPVGTPAVVLLLEAGDDARMLVPYADLVHRLSETEKVHVTVLVTGVRGCPPTIPLLGDLSADVLCLAHFLDVTAYRAFLQHVLLSRNPQAVLLGDSTWGQRIAPYLRMAASYPPLVAVLEQPELDLAAASPPRVWSPIWESLDSVIVLQSNELGVKPSTAWGKLVRLTLGPNALNKRSSSQRAAVRALTVELRRVLRERLGLTLTDRILLLAHAPAPAVEDEAPESKSETLRNALQAICLSSSQSVPATLLVDPRIQDLLGERKLGSCTVTTTGGSQQQDLFALATVLAADEVLVPSLAATSVGLQALLAMANIPLSPLAQRQRESPSSPLELHQAGGEPRDTTASLCHLLARGLTVQTKWAARVPLFIQEIAVQAQVALASAYHEQELLAALAQRREQPAVAVAVPASFSPASLHPSMQHASSVYWPALDLSLEASYTTLGSGVEGASVALLWLPRQALRDMVLVVQLVADEGRTVVAEWSGTPIDVSGQLVPTSRWRENAAVLTVARLSPRSSNGDIAAHRGALVLVCSWSVRDQEIVKQVPCGSREASAAEDGCIAPPWSRRRSRAVLRRFGAQHLLSNGSQPATPSPALLGAGLRLRGAQRGAVEWPALRLRLVTSMLAEAVNGRAVPQMVFVWQIVPDEIGGSAAAPGVSEMTRVPHVRFSLFLRDPARFSTSAVVSEASFTDFAGTEIPLAHWVPGQLVMSRVDTPALTEDSLLASGARGQVVLQLAHTVPGQPLAAPFACHHVVDDRKRACTALRAREVASLALLFALP